MCWLFNFTGVKEKYNFNQNSESEDLDICQHSLFFQPGLPLTSLASVHWTKRHSIKWLLSHVFLRIESSVCETATGWFSYDWLMNWCERYKPNEISFICPFWDFNDNCAKCVLSVCYWMSGVVWAVVGGDRWYKRTNWLTYENSQRKEGQDRKYDNALDHFR